MAENPDPTERQLVAYNAHDIEAFVVCYTEDVVVEDAAGTRLSTGREELRARYDAMWKKFPKVHAAVLSRIYVGDYILHEESVTGRQESPEHVVAIYRLKDGLIEHVRFVR